MSQHQFFALGTASQVPTKTRNHNGYFLKWGKEGFLFDPGEGTQRQMLYAGVSAKDITKILITHFHGDHCLGLPGVLQRISLDKVPHPVKVYFPASGLQYFNNLQHASIYYNTATIEICPIAEAGIIYQNEQLTISAAPLDHTVESWGYRIQDVDTHTLLADKLQAFGIRGALTKQLLAEGQISIGDQLVSLADVSVLKPGQSFAFVMDTRYCANAVKLAQEVDTLVAESTFLNVHTAEAQAHGHLTAAQAARIAQEAQAKRLILTHFSQRYADQGNFVGEAQPIFPEVVAVKDGDSLDLTRPRQVVV
ncbi:ribonuclease Z [uncultured Thiothrix sp.]|uniref:ribonuclease Z n=1 Tax=uncultured Thiothrix sp. TaxID=223185 RepID=UPI0026087147|nr:ribonuclease Z [uncultured Thiothrix sp.]